MDKSNIDEFAKKWKKQLGKLPKSRIKVIWKSSIGDDDDKIILRIENTKKSYANEKIKRKNRYARLKKIEEDEALKNHKKRQMIIKEKSDVVHEKIARENYQRQLAIDQRNEYYKKMEQERLSQAKPPIPTPMPTPVPTPVPTPATPPEPEIPLFKQLTEEIFRIELEEPPAKTKTIKEPPNDHFAEEDDYNVILEQPPVKHPVSKAKFEETELTLPVENSSFDIRGIKIPLCYHKDIVENILSDVEMRIRTKIEDILSRNIGKSNYYFIAEPTEKKRIRLYSEYQKSARRDIHTIFVRYKNNPQYGYQLLQRLFS